MFRLSSLLASSSRPLGPRRRVALFGGGLLLLWLAVTLAPSGPPAPPPVAERPAEAAARLPARAASAPGTASGAAPAGPSAEERLTHVPTRPARSLLRPGNVLAVLLLVGGVAWAVYLRRRPDGPATDGGAPLLEALAEVPLGPGQTLRLVRVGEETLLLGLGQGGVTLLRCYPPGEGPLSDPRGTAVQGAARTPAQAPASPAAASRAPRDRGATAAEPVAATVSPAFAPPAPAFAPLAPAAAGTAAPSAPRFADLLQHAVATAAR